MIIDGLSEATLENFIGMGFIHEFADIFRLKEHRESIQELEGFGEKSCENLLKNIETARNTTLVRLIYSLGIPGIGLANAKMLCRAFSWDWEKLKNSTLEELTAVDGIGEILAKGIIAYSFAACQASSAAVSASSKSANPVSPLRRSAATPTAAIAIGGISARMALRLTLLT